MQRLIARGRHPQVVDILEASLKRDPAPAPEESQLLREQAMDICLGVLRDPQRALSHVEGILLLDPNHVHARKLAEELVEHRQLGCVPQQRCPTLLTHGRDERAVNCRLRLKQVRARGVEVQRRLGIFRQDGSSIPPGLELLAPSWQRPRDDDLPPLFGSRTSNSSICPGGPVALARAEDRRDPAWRPRCPDGALCTSHRDPGRASRVPAATELLAMTAPPCSRYALVGISTRHRPAGRRRLELVTSST